MKWSDVTCEIFCSRVLSSFFLILTPQPAPFSCSFLQLYLGSSVGRLYVPLLIFHLPTNCPCNCFISSLWPFFYSSGSFLKRECTITEKLLVSDWCLKIINSPSKSAKNPWKLVKNLSTYTSYCVHDQKNTKVWNMATTFLHKNIKT